VFGIEGKKLLRPEDDFEALKDFTRECDGDLSAVEEITLEYQRLLRDHPDLAAKLESFPGKIFSGKSHPKPDSKAVFFCYTLPAPPIRDMSTGDPGLWSENEGEARWYLYDLATTKIAETPADIITLVRSTPETPRLTNLPKETLADIRSKVEKHIKTTYLRTVQAPAGVHAKLNAWMELS
jgi:hypothetical protein